MLAAGPGRCLPDLPQLPAGIGPQTLGQAVEDIPKPGGSSNAGGGSRVHLAQGGPQREAPIADREERRVETAFAQVAQDSRPRIGALAIAEGHPEQLLVPVRARADDDEQATRLGFESGAQVDPVGPQVGEGGLDRPAREGAVVGLPVGLEAQDRRTGEGGPFAEELAERRLEVTRGEALEVQPGEQALVSWLR